MTLPQAVLSMADETAASIVSPPRIDRFHLEPRCRVCRNDQVGKKVNDLLASGSSYAMIARAIGEDNAAGVTADSIRRHAERHFPVQNVAKATYREILERRAKENGVDFVNGVATALTPLAYYEVVMNEAFRRLVDGAVEVSVDTGLRAAEKLQAQIAARAGQPDMAGMLAEMGRVIEVVRTFIPSEKWPEVQAALRGDAPIRQQRRDLAANSFSREAAAELLGISPQSVTDKLESRKLVGIKVGREWRLPRWQFDPDNTTGTLPELNVLQAAFPGGPVSLSRWMMRPNPEFDGRTPREETIANGSASVIKVARNLTAAGW